MIVSNFSVSLLELFKKLIHHHVGHIINFLPNMNNWIIARNKSH